MGQVTPPARPRPASPLLAAAIIALATVLAACGGPGAPASQPAQPAEPPAAEAPPAEKAEPSQTTPTKADVTALVEAFMQARLEGVPADSFLAPAALEAFETHATGLHLYDEDIAGGDAGKLYEEFVASAPEPADGATWTVEVRIPFSWLGDAPPGEIVETLVVGPGETAGDPGQLLVLDAERAELETNGLPAEVAATREAVLAAAHARDYDALEGLLDPATFSYSFGENGDPIGYWRELEEEAEVPVLGDILPVVFETRFARLSDTAGDIYVWPSAAAKEAPEWTEQDIESMKALYTDEEIRTMREDFGGYLGWRIGIREDGTWLYFVAGD
jgi:hypothetical protein